MVQKVKDRIVGGLIMAVTGIVVAIFSVSYTNKKSDDKILQDEINALKRDKVDNNAFETYKKDHKLTHSEQENRIIDHVDTRFDDFKDFMIELNKNRD